MKTSAAASIRSYLRAAADRNLELAQQLYDRSRRGEISAMLGWMLVDARDDERAGRLFTAAAHDHVPAVRASAEAGIAVLARRAAR